FAAGTNMILTTNYVGGFPIITLSTAPTTNVFGTNIQGTIPLANLPAIPESSVTSLITDLGLKAPLASPTFTGVINGNGSGLTGIPESSVTSLVSDLALKAATSATVLKANNGSDFASLSSTASNVGVRNIPTTGTDWTEMAGSTPAYTGQLALTHNHYLIRATGTSAGNWSGYFNFFDTCSFGDPTHMTAGFGDEHRFWVNGTSATSDPNTNALFGDNVIGLKNQRSKNFSAMRWSMSDSDGGGERGAIGYGNSQTPFYNQNNYLEDYSNASGFYFASRGFINGGLQKTTGHFVWYNGASGTNDTTATKVFDVDTSGNVVASGSLTVSGYVHTGIFTNLSGGASISFPALEVLVVTNSSGFNTVTLPDPAANPGLVRTLKNMDTRASALQVNIANSGLFGDADLPGELNFNYFVFTNRNAYTFQVISGKWYAIAKY
ncbi:MAG: hypothetical protein JWR69_1173, partial [Pedosphaera sp.]|nr:hypothetical protein [Pedosphaera sp.]